MEPDEKTQYREYIVWIDGKPTVIQRTSNALAAAADVIVSQLGTVGSRVTGHVEHDSLDMRVGKIRVSVRPYPVSLFPSSEVYNVKEVPA